MKNIFLILKDNIDIAVFALVHLGKLIGWKYPMVGFLSLIFSSKSSYNFFFFGFLTTILNTFTSKIFKKNFFLNSLSKIFESQILFMKEKIFFLYFFDTFRTKNVV